MHISAKHRLADIAASSLGRSWVDVWLAKGSRHGHCRTSFVSHA